MHPAINFPSRLGLAFHHCVDHCLAELLAQQWLLDLLAAGAGDAAPAPGRCQATRSSTPASTTPIRQENLPC